MNGFWQLLKRSLTGRGSETGSKASEPKPGLRAIHKPKLSERDNVGTRYETQEKVDSFWIPYIMNRPKFPFIFYDMRDRTDAMNAMLSLPPMKALDSGKLISTEVLQFGVYPNERGGWGFFLAGEQITLALYEAAIASCEKYHGTNPRVSDPPKSIATISSNRSKPNSTAVTFDWEEKVDMLKQMKARGITIAGGAPSAPAATKRHYKAPNKDAALSFLKETPVDEPFYYLIVHTPDGAFGRDKDGIFEQP